MTAALFVIGSFVAACTVEVQTLPSPGESLAARAFAMEPGGKGFNLAVAARRLGAGVDGLFAVGSDDLAGLAEPAFLRADLPLAMLRRKPGPTGGGVGFIAQDGETCLAVASGANGALSLYDAREAAGAIAAADVCLAQFESPDPPILEAFAIARGAGRTTLLNPSPFRPPPAAMLAVTSILCVNLTEVRSLARSLDLDEAEESLGRLAEAVMALGPEAVVVTLGRNGAIAFRRGAAPIRQPAFAVAAIDALGAGDAFAATLAVSLGERRGWDDAMRRAAAAGALTASARGTFSAFPTEERLVGLIEKAGTARAEA